MTNNDPNVPKNYLMYQLVRYTNRCTNVKCTKVHTECTITR